jgi:hypothetical protein
VGWIDGDGSIKIDLLICPASIVQLLASFHCAQVTASHRGRANYTRAATPKAAHDSGPNQ